MTKIPEGKCVLYVYIDRNIDKRLRELIIRKYGEYRRGLLSYEVECALQAWLATHKIAQSNAKGEARINPAPKYWLVFQRCLAWIESKYKISFEEVHQIPARFLREAIAAVRGSDKRTIKKWLETFTEQKLIKWISPELIEVRG